MLNPYASNFGIPLLLVTPQCSFEGLRVESQTLLAAPSWMLWDLHIVAGCNRSLFYLCWLSAIKINLAEFGHNCLKHRAFSGNSRVDLAFSSILYFDILVTSFLSVSEYG